MRRLTKRHERQFVAAVERLNRLLAEVRVTIPDANFYLAEDSLHLMRDESHDSSGVALQANSMASVRLRYSGGGDW